MNQFLLTVPNVCVELLSANSVAEFEVHSKSAGYGEEWRQIPWIFLFLCTAFINSLPILEEIKNSVAGTTAWELTFLFIN